MKNTTRNGPKSQGLSTGHGQTTAAQGFAALFTEPQPAAQAESSAYYRKAYDIQVGGKGQYNDAEIFLAALKSPNYREAVYLLCDALAALREVTAHTPESAPPALALTALTVAYERRQNNGRPSEPGFFSKEEPSVKEGSDIVTDSDTPGPDRPVRSARRGPNRPLLGSRHQDVGGSGAGYASLFANEAQNGEGPTPEFFTPSLQSKGPGQQRFRLTPPPGPKEAARQPAPPAGPKDPIPGWAFPTLEAYCFAADTERKRKALGREAHIRVAATLRLLVEAGADIERLSEVITWAKTRFPNNTFGPEKFRELWWRAIQDLEPVPVTRVTGLNRYDGPTSEPELDESEVRRAIYG